MDIRGKKGEKKKTNKNFKQNDRPNTCSFLKYFKCSLIFSSLLFLGNFYNFVFKTVLEIKYIQHH